MRDQDTQKAITATLLSRYQDQCRIVEQLDRQIADMEEELARLKARKIFIQRDVELLRSGWVGSKEAEQALYLVELIDKRK